MRATRGAPMRRACWGVLASGGTFRQDVGQDCPNQDCHNIATAATHRLHSMRLHFMKRAILTVALAFGLGLSGGTADAQTLKTVKDRGSLLCGVSQGLPGFSAPDDQGNWTGIDVDVCRAIAAAIFT